MPSGSRATTGWPGHSSSATVSPTWPRSSHRNVTGATARPDPTAESARGARDGEGPREGEEHPERPTGVCRLELALVVGDELLSLVVVVEHAQHRAQARAPNPL